MDKLKLLIGNNIRAIFWSAGALLVAIPGLKAIQSGMMPHDARLSFFSLFADSVGALSVLLFWVNRAWVAKLGIRTITIVCICLMTGSFVAIFAYIFASDAYVVPTPSSVHRHPESILFPLWSREPLSSTLASYSSRAAATDDLGPQTIQDLIEQMPGHVLLIDLMKLMLLLLFQLPLLFVASAFLLIAIKLTAESAQAPVAVTDSPTGTLDTNPDIDPSTAGTG